MSFLDNLRNQLKHSDPTHSEEAHLIPAGAWDLLFESPDFLVAEINRTGIIQAANEEFAQVFGADVVGYSLPELAATEERGAITHLIGQVFGDVPGGIVVTRLRTHAERPPIIRWAILPKRNPAGKIGAAIGVGIDVTEFIESGASELDSYEIEVLRRKLALLQEENQSLRMEVGHRPATTMPDGTPLLIPRPGDSAGAE